MHTTTHHSPPRTTNTVAAVLATATALAGLSLTSPTAAHAAGPDRPDRPIADQMLNTDGVRLGVSKTKSMALSLYTYDSYEVDAAKAAVKSPNGTKKVTLTKAETENGYVHWVGKLAINPKSLDNSDAGAWPVTFSVTGEQADQLTIKIEVLRASRLSFNAGPEPVRDKKLTFAGTLTRASWNTDRYVPLKKQKVTVWYELKGQDDSEIEPIVDVRTNADGRYRVTRPTEGSGEYYASWAGTSTTGSQMSRQDHIG